MAWTVITKYTRPNTGVDWYTHADSSSSSPMSDADVAYVQSNYVDNGKRTSSTKAISDDGLELTKTFVFRDNAAYFEYMSDTRVKPNNVEQIEYNLTNNIDLVTRSSEET